MARCLCVTTEVQPSAGETPPAKPDSGTAAPEYVSRKDFEAWSSDFAKKHNGEMASLRKATKEPASNGQAKAAEHESNGGHAQRDAVTYEDLKLSREVGRLEAQLGDEIVAEIGEEYSSLPFAQQAAFLRAALKIRGATPTNGAGGETPAKQGARRPQTSRAEPPAPRESAPRPRSQIEHAELKKTNPKAVAELMKLDDYDPGRLPYSAP